MGDVSKEAGSRAARAAIAARAQQQNVALQFVDGTLALWRGLRFVVENRNTWGFAAAPMAVCLVLCVVSIGAAINYVPPLLAAMWPDLAHPTSTWGSWGSGFLRFVVTLLAALLGIYAAAFLAPLVSAPALEHLVLLRERALGVTPRSAAGFFREFVSALRAQLISLLVFSPLLLALWFVTVLAPPAAVATVPLQCLVLGVVQAWSLLDYPLSMRGVPVSSRLRLMKAGAARVLGFGLALALLFTVPLAPLLLLPAAVAGAAEIALQLERS